MLDYTIPYNDKFLKLFEGNELLKKLKFVRTVLCSLVLDLGFWDLFLLNRCIAPKNLMYSL